jgi:hypothetical protein
MSCAASMIAWSAWAPAISRARRRASSRRRTCRQWRCRVPVQLRRGSQRSALHRRVPWQRPRIFRSDHRRTDALRGGAGASRDQLGADEVSRARPGTPPAANAMTASALHQAMRWGGNALDLVEGEAHARFGGLTGLRFNIGKHRRRHQGQRDRAERRGALRVPPAAVAGHRWVAPAFPFLRDRRRAGTLRGDLPRPVVAGRRRGDCGIERRLLRATSPTSSACRSAMRSISGPRPRCSRRPA